MSRNFKTSQGNRINFIYYTAEGTKIVITPGENGVTEMDIKLLHDMDDAEVDEQRRYEYRVTAHLDAYYDGGNCEADDRNSYLADDSTNPETIFINNEDKIAYQELILKLITAMNSLFPQQLELLKKVYVDKRSKTDIATEEEVSEAAIRNRLKKIHERLKKSLS